MGIKKILVLSSDEKAADKKDFEINEALTINKWTPGLFRYLPPNAPGYYILFWFAHYFKLFRNNSYCAFYLENTKKDIVSSLIFAPKLFIWPFMDNKDVQIKSGFTIPEYRGKGLSFFLRQYALRFFQVEQRTVWSLVHSDNAPSIAVNKKSGLIIRGHYKIKKKMFFFIKIGAIKPLEESHC